MKSDDTLEARLRALPPLPVPVRLEARLLAAIPATQRPPRRRWAVLLAAGGALAATVLVALAWHRHQQRPDLPNGMTSIQPTKKRAPANRAPGTIPTVVRGSMASADWGNFAWPLEEATPLRASSPIPADLFD